MPTCDTADLPPLAWVHQASEKFDPDLILPMSPLTRTETGKPTYGGLWTSPMYGPGDCAWTRAVRDMSIHYDDELTVSTVVPHPGGLVAVVESVADLADLVTAYPGTTPIQPVAVMLGHLPADAPALVADFQALACAGYAAFWLTSPGLRDCGQRHLEVRPARTTARDAWLGALELYGWDCETVLWLRPALDVRDSVPAAGM